MAKKEKTPNPTWPNVRRLLKFSGKQRTWLIVALACDTVLSVTLIISNAFTRNAFDAVVAKQTQAFWIYTLGMDRRVVQHPLFLP